MPDLDFLPDWYPKSRRRKRLVLLQGYMTLLLAGGLGAWLFLAHRNAQVASRALANIEMQVSQTHQELHQLEEQVALKNQLLVQRQIVEKLGLPVELSRLLYALDQNLPTQMSLTDLAFDTQEQLKTAGTPAAARGVRQGDGIDRRLRVKLEGVAPTDTDVANFLAGLARVSFFDDVALSSTRDLNQGGRVMREFEVTFSIGLNQKSTG